MGRIVTHQCRPAPTHDLIRLRETASLIVDEAAPSWVEEAIQRAPWVVVRRGYASGGLIPVGVRGVTRKQRFAGRLRARDAAQQISPDDLATAALENNVDAPAPARSALAHVAPVLDRSGWRWGPGGSVGFEIATGVPAATPSSDLDLILFRGHPLEPGEAGDLHASLVEAAMPVRVDVMVETPRGGVLLADLAAASAHVLVRTPDGPVLSADPWITEPAPHRRPSFG